MKKKKYKDTREKRKQVLYKKVIIIESILGVCLLLFVGMYVFRSSQPIVQEPQDQQQSEEKKGVIDKLISGILPDKEEEEPDVAVFVEADPAFAPYCTETTDPSNLIVSTDV